MPLAGEIWLADIPFIHGVASKLRPVLLLWVDGSDVVVAAVTSAAGLRVPSTVRLSRLDCLEGILLRRRLGVVSQADAQHLKQCWANQIRLQF